MTACAIPALEVSGQAKPARSPRAVFFLPMYVRPPGGLIVAAKFLKKSSAVFLAAPLTSRWPSCASLPPICASTL